MIKPGKILKQLYFLVNYHLDREAPFLECLYLTSLPPGKTGTPHRGHNFNTKWHSYNEVNQPIAPTPPAGLYEYNAMKDLESSKPSLREKGQGMFIKAKYETNHSNRYRKVRFLRNLHEITEHGKRIRRSNIFASRRGNSLDPIDNGPRPNRPRASTPRDTPLAQSSLDMGHSESTKHDGSQRPILDTTGQKEMGILEGSEITAEPKSRMRIRLYNTFQKAVA